MFTRFITPLLELRKMIGWYHAIVSLICIKLEFPYHYFCFNAKDSNENIVIVGGGWHVKYAILPIVRKSFRGNIFIIRENKNCDLRKIYNISYVDLKIATDLDAERTKVIVACRPDLQLYYTNLFINAGFQTYCEKPLITKSKSYKTALQLIEEKNKHFYFGMNRRNSAGFRFLYERCKNSIEHYTHVINFGLPTSKSLEFGGNPLNFLAIHAIDHFLEFVDLKSCIYSLDVSLSSSKAYCRLKIENGPECTIILLMNGNRNVGSKDDIIVTGGGETWRLIDYSQYKDIHEVKKFTKDIFGLEKSLLSFIGDDAREAIRSDLNRLLLKITTEILENDKI